MDKKQKGSRYLRWILQECVHAHIRTEKNSNIAQFYYRIAKKKGNSKAASVPVTTRIGLVILDSLSHALFQL